MTPSAPTVVILHSGSFDAARPDEMDTLTQVAELQAYLDICEWEHHALSYDLGENCIRAALLELEPTLVFNLVESALGSDAEVWRATQLLDKLNVAYTGAPTACLRRTASKSRLKRVLQDAAIPTPEWVKLESGSLTPHAAGRYIVKSECEHGSLGLDASCVIDAADLAFTITNQTNRYGGEWFAERFVDGREFNVALLANGSGVQVLPLAEISFAKLPENLPRIVDYSAKWHEASVHYQGTERIFPALPAALSEAIAATAIACWHACGLKAYARIDLRLDEAGTPYVIDVNPNPCLSADAGFMAAASRAGLSAHDVYHRILSDAHHAATTTTEPIMG